MSKSSGFISSLLALGITAVSAGMLLWPAGVDGSGWMILSGIALGLLILGLAIWFRAYALVHLSLFFVLLFGWKYSPLWPAELPTGLLAPSFCYLFLAFS